MDVRAALLLVFVSSLQACSGTNEPTAEEARTAPSVTPSTEGSPEREARPEPPPIVADTSLISLVGPGFTQVVSSGTAGGPIAGQTMSPHCVGSFPTSYQHNITIAQAIPHVRIVVNAGPSDTTLAVRFPDGSYVCGDDSDDPANALNPFVDLNDVQPGSYHVFVGGYSSGDAWASYALGVTEARSFPSEVVPAP